MTDEAKRAGHPRESGDPHRPAFPAMDSRSRGNDEDGAGRNEADGAVDLLNLLAQFGLGEIDLVLEQF